MNIALMAHLLGNGVRMEVYLLVGFTDLSGIAVDSSTMCMLLIENIRIQRCGFLSLPRMANFSRNGLLI